MSLIEKANEAYYNKEEKILTDQEFDLLEENGLGIVNFRNKVDHFQPMGSLKKIKTEEQFNKWCPKHAEISITPKLDGNSVEIIIVDGKFAQAITRGNGFVGNDISDKVVHCNIMHEVIPGEKHYSIKCEAIMKKEFQKDYDKNIRNVVAGLLNKKTPIPEELAKIDIIPFMELDNLLAIEMTYEELADGYEEKKEHYEYEIDGLVIELYNHIYEEKKELLPANSMALKFNKTGVLAEIGDIEWGLGKHAKLTPVLLLKEAVEIDGTMVKRVSASNWSLLVAAGLGIGAIIRVIKSGDIIPFVSEVVERSDDIIYPQCPVCSTTGIMNESEVQMICPNPDCAGKDLIKLQHIFKTFDLEYVSDRTVEKLYENGVRDLDSFFKLTRGHICGLPGFGMSKASNIVHKLKNVTLNEAQVLKCAMVQGISESNGQKIIDHYGDILHFFGSIGLDHTVIKGIGDTMSETINENGIKFLEIYSQLKKYITITKKEIKKNIPEILNIVFTGTCRRFGRKELTIVLESNNYNVQKAINKITDILLVADPNSNSGKIQKATKLGVKIKSYEDFFKENKI